MQSEVISPPDVRPWYDNESGILDALKTKGLAGLNDIWAARAAARDDGWSLHGEFCVLRRFILDTYGQIWRLEEEIHVEARSRSDADLALASRQRWVMPKVDAFTFRRMISMTPCGLPSVDARCDRCGRGWDLQDVGRAVGVRMHAPNEQIWRHDDCEHLRQIQDGMAEIKEILLGADPMLAIAPIRWIPNQYWPDVPHYPKDPWAIVETPLGEIELGWRKKVFVINWTKAEQLLCVAGSEIVADLKTTHSASMVHCWGAEAASAALKKLYQIGMMRCACG